MLINGTGNISPSVNGTRTTSTSLFFNGIDATNITSNEGSLTRQHLAGARDARGSQAADQPLRRVDRPFGRRQLPAGHAERHERVPRTRATSTSSTRSCNANDFFYKKDGIDKPKARRNEGGFTVGGPLRRNKLFFFGGYQRTQAETGFVPTASSITVLPQALPDSGRAHEGEPAGGVRGAEPGHPDVDSEGAVRERDRHARASPTSRSKLFNLRNPVTGDYVIPAPRAGGTVVGNDIDVGPSVGGNPLVRQRNVVPAEFQQDQFTLKLDTQLTRTTASERDGVLREFPGLDPFPDPSSLASPFTLRRADRNATVAISDTH